MSNQEYIKILHHNSDSWNPYIGDETIKLIKHLQIEGIEEKLKNETHSILQKCINPNGSNKRNTGLIIGYVQSGKTMSFTTLTAMARDNNFQMVIVITGISVPLFNQSKDRLLKDLRIDNKAERKWRYFENPTENNRNSIKDTLDDWKDNSIPLTDKQSVLIVVMKNHRHLENLNKLFSSIQLKNDPPTIIIDDEADQASLNTLVRQDGESTTYRRILELRDFFKKHSFLQYTATPQAPLLINIIDTLSPDFVEVLTPGEAYTGGKEFFCNNKQLIIDIPRNEIPTNQNELDQIPESLKDALRLFFIGVAVGIVKESQKGNRSMMIHPSQKTSKHNDFYDWVVLQKDDWKSILDRDDSDSEKIGLLKEFETSYEKIKSTYPDIPTFDEIKNKLGFAIRKTNIQVLNASRGKTPNVDWNSVYSHILVGGQAMDRGFTVEGLTVTYMPRMLGIGNADTFQQRARFFGYKKNYLGLCRVFLDEDVRIAYEHYVEHEEDIRSQMLELKKQGIPLKDWKRLFLLTNDLRPTRTNVLHLDYMRLSFTDSWLQIDAPHDSEELYKHNQELVKEFIKNKQFIIDELHPKASSKNKILENHELSDVYENLLCDFKVSRSSDTRKFVAALLVIKYILENNQNEKCTVYLMSGGEPRERGLDPDTDEIKQLYTGANPVEPKELRGTIYPGDREKYHPNNITIQIHILNLKKHEEIVFYEIPTIAIHIPKRFTADFIYQQQP